jgi:hypothetical protein
MQTVASRTRSARNSVAPASEEPARRQEETEEKRQTTNLLLNQLGDASPRDFIQSIAGRPKTIWQPVLIGLIKNNRFENYLYMLTTAPYNTDLSIHVFNRILLSNPSLQFPSLTPEAVKRLMASITSTNSVNWIAHLNKTVFTATNPDDTYVSALCVNGLLNITDLTKIKKLTGPMARAWVKHVWIPALPKIKGTPMYTSENKGIDIVLYAFKSLKHTSLMHFENFDSDAWLEAVDEALPHWKFVLGDGRNIVYLINLINRADSNLLTKLAARLNVNARSMVVRVMCGFAQDMLQKKKEHAITYFYNTVMMLTRYCKIDLTKVVVSKTSANFVYTVVATQDTELIRILSLHGAIKDINDCAVTYNELARNPKLKELIKFNTNMKHIIQTHLLPGLYHPDRVPKTSPSIRAAEERKQRWTVN